MTMAVCRGIAIPARLRLTAAIPLLTGMNPALAEPTRQGVVTSSKSTIFFYKPLWIIHFPPLKTKVSACPLFVGGVISVTGI
jgi:hypothetical protein